MKKFFAFAVMALAIGFFASCSGSSSSASYKPGDPAPQIDYTAGTVNGIAYENKTDKCWKQTVTATVYGQSASDVSYTWNTEFAVKAAGEMAAYASAQMGVGTYTFSYVEAPQYKDSESCLANNEK